LARLPETLATKLIALIGDDAKVVAAEGLEHIGESKTKQEAEADRIERIIKLDTNLPDTEKEAQVKARKGQGRFREDVLNLHKNCPFTGITNPSFLKAGHIKPWAKCDNGHERLDPLNGIPLSPDADVLFDEGYVTFQDDGHALFSTKANANELIAMGINIKGQYTISILNDRQKSYLDYHRKHIFKH
jgi:predicted restriction endonuclease